MITEDYVSFEVAKLLKEKGFDEKCHMCWDEVTKIMESADEYATNSGLLATYISAPTLQMAMKWLRDTYSLEIYPFHAYCEYNDEWWFEIIRFPVSYAEYESDAIYLKYEVACEAAVRYCLENLI